MYKWGLQPCEICYSIDSVAKQNLFADIGLENADALLARARIGVEILKTLMSRSLKQLEIGQLLGIKQAEASTGLVKPRLYDGVSLIS